MGRKKQQSRREPTPLISGSRLIFDRGSKWGQLKTESYTELYRDGKIVKTWADGTEEIIEMDFEAWVASNQG